MQYTSSIITSLIDFINETVGLTDIFTAVRAYEAGNLPVPIKKTYVAFSTNKNTVTLFENDNEEYCQANDIIIRMNCYTPLTTSPLYIYTLLEIVLDYIQDEYSSEMTGFTIEETGFDSDVNSYKITAYLNFSYESCAAEGSENANLAATKEFYCKTHIADNDSHITPSDRAYLDAPFVTGTYVGSGFDGTNEIALGFKPKAVIVFRNSYHPALHDSTAQDINYFGFACASGNTRGINITATGFTVTQKESYASIDSNTHLNYDGITYVYIAFK